MIGLDTNLLAYALGVDGAVRQKQAVKLLNQLERHRLFLPVQVAGELFRVLVGKARRTPAQARVSVAHWMAVCTPLDTTAESFHAAVELATAHRLQIWDAIILSVAADADCAMLLSEDMHDGFVYRGMTVVNPFAATLHPLLASYLEASP